MSSIVIAGDTSGLVEVKAPLVAGTTVLELPNSSGSLVGSDTNGHILPKTAGSNDLGSAAARWRNIYTNDLHLSNGIGDYTIVEGEEDLFLYNNKSGRVFKFALIEVDLSAAAPKQEV